MAYNAMQFVLESVQGAADMVAGELVDVRWPDGATLTGVTMLHPVEQSNVEVEGGLLLEIKVRTFTVSVAALGGRLPEREMLLTWRGQTFKAVHPGGGKVWEYQDHEQSRVEINTIAVAPPAIAGGAYAAANGNAYGAANGDAYGRP